MPNRNIHVVVGAAVGGAVALFRASDQQPENALIETLGGGLGGRLSARVPDFVDPPTWPGHRSIGHGVMPNAAVVGWYLSNLPEWQSVLRGEAEVYRREAERTASAIVALWYRLLEVCYRLVSGLVAGAAGGLISHLVLDAGTKRSLPIFG